MHLRIFPFLVILFIAACDQKNKEIPQLFILDNPVKLGKYLGTISRHPLEEMTHQGIYNFIYDELRKNLTPCRQKALKRHMKNEKLIKLIAQGQLLKTDWPEGPMNQILHVFCDYYPQCRRLSLYKRNGFILASAIVGDGDKSDLKDIIEDPLYNQYMQGNLILPHINSAKRRITFPVMDKKKPIGFIVLDYQ